MEVDHDTPGKIGRTVRYAEDRYTFRVEKLSHGISFGCLTPPSNEHGTTQSDSLWPLILILKAMTARNQVS